MTQVLEPSAHEVAPPAGLDVLVSSDSHVIEPVDLWATRLPAALRDRAPVVVREDEGDYWYVDGLRTNSFAGGVQAGQRFEDPSKLVAAARFEDVVSGGYVPTAHLADNALDGIWGSVVYPTEGLLLFAIADLNLLHAVCAAYNDWLADFCSHDPGRLKGVAMVPLDDVDWAVAEVARVASMRLGGVMIPVSPTPGTFYGQPDQERFWAAVAEARLPVSLHIGSNRASLAGSGEFRTVRPSTMVNADVWVRNSLADLILTGVFERHEHLRVGTVEHELGWIPFFLDRLDYTYTQRAQRPGWHRFSSSALPSDFFRRNVFASFQEDAAALRDREIIGMKGLMFGSDYPHTESTFPRSRQVMAEVTAGLSPAEVEAIVWRNCAELYGFSEPRPTT